jgi:23S rRNA pseudouridine2605 synthase
MTTKNSSESIRLNRFLAQLGVASRRSCDELIEAGKVRVGGKRVTRPGVKIIPGVDTVAVDGFKLDKPTHPMVLLLHKPTGVVSTVSDPQGRPTVIDFCKRYARRRRLFPIGRLDVNTTGALLLTNDGLLCYRLTHPRFRIPKTYRVQVRGGFNDLKLQKLRKMTGVEDTGKRTGRPVRESASTAAVELIKQMEKVTILKITLVEGRNRQVRRMCDAVGLRVVKLKRLSFGSLSVRTVPLGAVRPLTKKELERLNAMTEKGEKRDED